MMPFPGGIENISNGTLIFSALLALFYLFMVERPPSHRRTMLKVGSVLLLAALAVMEGGPILLIAALILSAIGDAFLAYNGDRAFMGGLVAFLLGHLAYVALFLLGGGGIDAIAGWRITLAALMVLAVAGSIAVLWRGVPGAMRRPVLVYSLAIMAMGIASLTVPNPVVTLGAVLFMASDSLLALARFRPDLTEGRGWVPFAVWALYYLGQALIALGVLAIA